jgi:hypothetical protein
MMPGSGSNSGAAAGLILNKMHPSSHQSSSTTLDSSGAGHHHGYPGGSKRTTLLSLKQLSGGKSNSLLLAPSARDGFYGPVSGGLTSTAAESDSDTSSFYHEPYQQRPVISNGTFQNQQQRMLHQQRGYPASSPADPEYGCLIQKEPLVLTPKGLHSNGQLYHKQQSKSASNTLAASGYANPQPYSSIKSFFKSSGSVVAPSSSSVATATSFVNSQPENYYATTDIIHVSRSFPLSPSGSIDVITIDPVRH